MNTDDRVHLSDLNLSEYVREMTRWNAAGEIYEQNDLLLTRATGNFPTTQVAIRLNAAMDDAAAEAFERIRRFYGEKKSSFSIHIRRHRDGDLEEICRKENLIQISEAPGMAVDHPFEDLAVPQEYQLRHITDVEGVADFACVTTQSYQSLGMPVHVGESIFASPARLLRPYNDLVVAYESDRPVSAAMVMFSHGIAGIYWVGTVNNARGKGLGEACAREVTNVAFRRGAALVVLQASKFGEPIYTRMGFKEITRYPWFAHFEK
jgi:ribosomal protein S18 acetylase RimI-like enzyme